MLHKCIYCIWFSMCLSPPPIKLTTAGWLVSVLLHGIWFEKAMKWYSNKVNGFGCGLLPVAIKSSFIVDLLYRKRDVICSDNRLIFFRYYIFYFVHGWYLIEHANICLHTKHKSESLLDRTRIISRWLINRLERECANKIHSGFIRLSKFCWVEKVN